jgi:transposase
MFGGDWFAYDCAHHQSFQELSRFHRLPAVHRELRRKGVTLQLVWEEYRATHPDG